MDEITVINGFTRTKHPFQIFTWIYFLQLIICFSAVVIPNLNEVLLQVINFCSFFFFQIFAGLIFFCLTLFMLYYAFISTYIDPTDEMVQEERRKKRLQELIEIKEYYCSQCDTHVSSKSKHCRVCDRCVTNFDHHCKWLNNCIGEKNYSPFFRLIIIVDLEASSFIIFSFLSCTDYNTIFIWVWINVAVVSILLFMNLNLTIFHIYLQSKRMTTYEYIIHKRLEKQKKDDSLLHSSNSSICPCLQKRNTVLPTVTESQAPKSQPTHRVIEALSNHGICNEIDVQKTQIIEETLKKETVKKDTQVDQNNEFQSPEEKQQRQGFQKKVSQKLLIEQEENLQQFEQKERSEGNTINDEQDIEHLEGQFQQHGKKITAEG